MADTESTKVCPFCGETIPVRATQCRYCREVLETDSPQQEPEAAPAQTARDDAFPSMHAPQVDTQELFRVTPSLVALLGTFFWCGLLIVISGVLLFYPLERLPLIGSRLGEDVLRIANKWKLIVCLGIIAAAGLWAAVRVVALKCIVYSATNDRLEWERGIFSRPVDNLDLFRIADLRLNRPFLDRLLGVGTIEIHSSDKTTPKLVLKKIRDPKRIYDLLKQESLRADRRRGVIHMD